MQTRLRALKFQLKANSASYLLSANSLLASNVILLRRLHTGEIETHCEPHNQNRTATKTNFDCSSLHTLLLRTEGSIELPGQAFEPLNRICARARHLLTWHCMAAPRQTYHNIAQVCKHTRCRDPCGFHCLSLATPIKWPMFLATNSAAHGR